MPLVPGLWCNSTKYGQSYACCFDGRTDPKFQNTHEIHTITIDGEPWFVAKDVCKVLGITNPTTSLNHLHDYEKTKLRFTEFQTPGRGGDRGLRVLISESGLYKLIMKSRKPEAVAFQDWVTQEVLPQIRKTGGYIPVEQGDTDDQILAKAYIIAMNTIKEKEGIIKGLTTQLTEKQTVNGFFAFHLKRYPRSQGERIALGKESTRLAFRAGIPVTKQERVVNNQWGSHTTWINEYPLHILQLAC